MKTKVCLALCAVFLMTGCIPFERNGSKYYVVLGAGILRVTQTNQVSVVKADTFGVYAGDGRVNLGLSSVYSARVPTNANVLLQITK